MHARTALQEQRRQTQLWGHRMWGASGKGVEPNPEDSNLSERRMGRATPAHPDSGVDQGCPGGDTPQVPGSLIHQCLRPSRSSP